MTLFNIFLVLHIAGGGIALLSGPVAITARKGGRLHRRAGLTFAAAMGAATLIGFPLSLIIGNALLLMISVFTFFLIQCGVLAIRRRRARRATQPADYAAPLLTAAFSVGLFAYGLPLAWRNGQPEITCLFFGVLGLAAVLREIRALRGPATNWLQVHIANMLGAYIATTTAFLVVNLTLLPQAVVFIGPTLAGVPLIIWMTRRHAPRRATAAA